MQWGQSATSWFRLVLRTLRAQEDCKAIGVCELAVATSTLATGFEFKGRGESHCVLRFGSLPATLVEPSEDVLASFDFLCRSHALATVLDGVGLEEALLAQCSDGAEVLRVIGSIHDIDEDVAVGAGDFPIRRSPLCLLPACAEGGVRLVFVVYECEGSTLLVFYFGSDHV